MMSTNKKRAALLAFFISDRCFLCNGSCLEANPVVLHKIFEQRSGGVDDRKQYLTLAEILTSAMGSVIKQSEVHSSVLCGSCYEKLMVYEDLEKKLSDSRKQILTAYVETMKTYRQSALPLSKENNMSQDSTENAELSNELLADSENIAVEEIDYYISDNDGKNDERQIEIEIDANEDEEERPFNDISQINIEDSDNREYTVETIGVEYLIEDTNDVDTKIDEDDVNIENDFLVQSSSSQPSAIDQTHKAKGQCVEDLKTIADNENSLILRDGERFRCQLCDKSQWQNLVNITRHMLDVHNRSLESCCLCHEVFTAMDKLDEHINQTHGDITTFECAKCHRAFATYFQLQKHTTSHGLVNEKRYSCYICQSEFSLKPALLLHMNLHKVTNPPSSPKVSSSIFQCDECDKTYSKAHSLAQHKKLHVKTKNFVCSVCSKAFRTQQYLDVHAIVHSGDRPYVCGTCGKSFARRNDLRDHERIHTGERPFKCDLCELAFAQRSNLTSHKKTTHFNEKQHKCVHCTRSFKRRRLLEYHVRARHTGERPHICESCGAAFVYPDHLKKHSIIHTGKRPYSCDFCGKQFNSRENRNAHYFVHSDKKPYECVDCGAGFMRKPHLLAHLRQFKHSDETIIVNPPQLNKASSNITAKAVSIQSNSNSSNNNSNIEYINVENDENTPDQLVEVDDESILHEIDTNKSNDDRHLINETNINDIKYLELVEDNNDDDFAWIIMKPNE